METTTAPMTKGRKMAKKQPRNDEQVKIDADIVSEVRIVCAYRKVVMAEYLSGILRDVVSRDLAHEQAKAMKGPKPKGGSK